MEEYTIEEEERRRREIEEFEELKYEIEKIFEKINRIKEVELESLKSSLEILLRRASVRGQCHIVLQDLPKVKKGLEFLETILTCVIFDAIDETFETLDALSE